jgi:SAM-dependent methyltransferase
MTDDRQQLQQWLESTVTSGGLRSAVLSGPVATETVTGRTAVRCQRVDVRAVSIGGRLMYQFTSSSKTQQFHSNHEPLAALTELVRLAGTEFRHLHAVSVDSRLEVRFSKRGRCFLKRLRTADRADGTGDSISAAERAGTVNPGSHISGFESASVTRPGAAPSGGFAHDRTLVSLIPEGQPCGFLIETGVMTPEGRVRAGHRRKFRQINRYLEFIRDILPALPVDRPLRVVDFGCGKSYLTFALQHYLTEVLHREARICGLDQRADVVATSRRIAEELRLSHLSFEQGTIAGFEVDEPPDLVVSLHACDTATDDALAQAVRWGSRAILAVPCCQHELLTQLAASALAPLTTYGITRERFASLATDTLRAALMTAAGWPSDVIEFIDTEHTPKNLLVRCVRSDSRPLSAAARLRAWKSVQELAARLHTPPLTLQRHLEATGLLPPNEA